MPSFHPKVIFLAAVACLALGGFGRPAAAADWYTGAPSDKTLGTTASLDISVDATSQRSDSLAIIGTIAPFAPMEVSGARIRLGGVLGQYSYISTTTGRIQGKQAEGAALGGYEWVARNATFSLYGGLTVRSSELTPLDPNNPVKGTQIGAKVAADFYVNPNAWTMAAGTASYSTANSAYYARFKTGIAISENVFIGPELAALGDKFFSQWRIGGHISGVTIGRLQLGVSGGYLSDKVRGSGVYGSADARVTF